MRAYGFTFWLADDVRDLDEWSGAVYQAGGDDSSCGTRGGGNFVIFDREADSLEAAIRSAGETIRKAGLQVMRLEIEQEELASLGV